MSPLRLQGSTSGFSQIDAPAVAGDQTFTLPGTGGTLDRLNRAGNILQVVNGSTNASTSNTTSTFADTTLTATITPTSASSKILVIVNQVGCFKSVGNTGIHLQLLRGSTFLCHFERSGGYNNSTTPNLIGTCGVCYLDSPATTSATTYKTQFASSAGINGVNVQVTDGATQGTSTITLIEVAA